MESGTGLGGRPEGVQQSLGQTAELRDHGQLHIHSELHSLRLDSIINTLLVTLLLVCHHNQWHVSALMYRHQACKEHLQTGH